MRQNLKNAIAFSDIFIWKPPVADLSIRVLEHLSGKPGLIDLLQAASGLKNPEEQFKKAALIDNESTLSFAGD